MVHILILTLLTLSGGLAASPPTCRAGGACLEALVADAAAAGEGSYLLQTQAKVAPTERSASPLALDAFAGGEEYLELTDAAPRASKGASAAAESDVMANVLPGVIGLVLVAALMGASNPVTALKENLAKYVAEFVGTFVLVFTVGCCMHAGSAVWNATAIACVFMVMIYSTGYVSGGNLNPAVSLALVLTGNLTWSEMLKYWFAQVTAGASASGLVWALFGKPLALAPVGLYLGQHALAAEVIYTFMLCFVVLNCAASKRVNNPEDSNQFFALAIGFVIIAGGYAVGGVSGAAFNPAVALGLDVKNFGFGWGIWYAMAELSGAALAAIMYTVMRPEEASGADFSNYTPALPIKLLSEFLGTFMLMVTVGLNVANGSTATAFSAAAALMCMIYALGDVSGAHFNPAVTVAIVLRGACSISDAVAYVLVQLSAGLCAGWVAAIFHTAGPLYKRTITLHHGTEYALGSMAFAELFFTFVLAYVVLAVATTKPAASQTTAQKFYFALAIGSCFTAGGFAIGGVSGGELNPAVSVGLDMITAMSPAPKAQLPPLSVRMTLLASVVGVEIVGGVLAAIVFRFTHPKEFNPNAPTQFAKLLCEFIGTFTLVFTVGCCVLAGSGTFNATAIASVFMVMIYATGPVSGGNLNPAVSFCLGLTGALEWPQVFRYWIAQLLGGAAAGVSYLAMFSPKAATLEPVAPFGASHAFLMEVIYTFMLCFVVLNVVVSKRNNPATDGNQFFALAIGFVIIAGGYAAGGISGACFNPAVALGVDIKNVGLGWGLSWAVAEMLGAAAAVALYKLVRPDEKMTGEEFDSYVPALFTRCLSEFLGVFMLVLTVGLNVIMASPAVAWSAAASLMCMTYALGNVSGAHFNPAVTLAVVASGRNLCSVKDGCAYVVAQTLAGGAAGLLTGYLHAVGPSAAKTFALEPGTGYSLTQAGFCEFFFTFVLAYVILAVATTQAPASLRTKQSFQFALAIGSCVTAGGFAVGSVSGGELNPAVGVGMAVQAMSMGSLPTLATWEFSGALLASVVFRLTHPTEFALAQKIVA